MDDLRKSGKASENKEENEDSRVKKGEKTTTQTPPPSKTSSTASFSTANNTNSAANNNNANNNNANNKQEVDEEDEEDTPEDSSSEDELSSDNSDNSNWISWFCSLKENEFFCEVDEDFIQDDFNLTGLSSLVPHYDYALDVILDTETDDVLAEEHQDMIEAAAEMLYGLIHARYILSNRGLTAMAEKWNNQDFGRCPRVYCQGQPVLPVGQSDLPRINTVKVYCPKCNDIYYPKVTRHANIDGSYFGTTFPHLLLQTYPELAVTRSAQVYVPRIYGFKIHQPRTESAQPPIDANTNTNNNANPNNPIQNSSTTATPQKTAQKNKDEDKMH